MITHGRQVFERELCRTHLAIDKPVPARLKSRWREYSRSDTSAIARLWVVHDDILGAGLLARCTPEREPDSYSV